MCTFHCIPVDTQIQLLPMYMYMNVTYLSEQLDDSQ